MLDDAPAPQTRFLSHANLARAAYSTVLPSEGGHADFPFASAEEYDFAAFVRAATGKQQLIGEAVVSGSGLGHLYAYITGTRLPDRETPEKAQDNPDVMRWFARFYGRVCRNFCLEALALRGLFITGGMALRLPVLEHPTFLEEFRNSDDFASLLGTVPIRHVRSHRAGLWGAALCAIVSSMKKTG